MSAQTPAAAVPHVAVDARTQRAHDALELLQRRARQHGASPRRDRKVARRAARVLRGRA